jgi:hydrogenase maturation protein HypF
VLLRRGRGHVPASFTLAHPTPRPLLACGGHLKNSFALAEGASLWPGPHVGDLETFEAENDYERMVERFSAFTDVRPEAFVHDLHPSYFTTAWAERRRAATRIGVQHHHAHLAATLVEHGISSPVLGLAWDGTGFGTDGTAWGGELLLADLVSFRRMATLRPIALAGGDLAIREVWRIALAVLDDAFGEGDQGAAPIEALPLFAAVDPAAVALVRRMTARCISCPRARGVGRAFDAAAAIVLAATASRFEGDAANRLAFIADPAEERSYDFALTPDAAGGPAEIDLRPAWRALALETLAGTPAHTVAARFQNTLTACAVAAVEHAEAEVGRLPVALSGGCFQNPALVGGIRSALGPGRNVLLHGAVPPNDGGLAVGQAAVGAAVLAGAAGRLGADAERPTVREGN